MSLGPLPSPSCFPLPSARPPTLLSSFPRGIHTNTRAPLSARTRRLPQLPGDSLGKANHSVTPLCCERTHLLQRTPSQLQARCCSSSCLRLALNAVVTFPSKPFASSSSSQTLPKAARCPRSRVAAGQCPHQQGAGMEGRRRCLPHREPSRGSLATSLPAVGWV